MFLFVFVFVHEMSPEHRIDLCWRHFKYLYFQLLAFVDWIMVTLFCHKECIIWNISCLIKPLFCFAGIHPPLPGLSQGGPVRRSPAVLGLLPSSSHETLELLRLPAALCLISSHLLIHFTVGTLRSMSRQDRSRWRIIDLDYLFFVWFFPELFLEMD